MGYDDDEDSLGRENEQTIEDDDEEPRKGSGNRAPAEKEILANQKRGYTAQERDMIEEWLRRNKPKTDASEEEQTA